MQHSKERESGIADCLSSEQIAVTVLGETDGTEAEEECIGLHVFALEILWSAHQFRDKRYIILNSSGLHITLELHYYSRAAVGPC